MAPSRGKGKASAVAAANANSGSRRALTRSTRKAKDAEPNIYEELLEEALSSPTATTEGERPLKKRRTATAVHVPSQQTKISQPATAAESSGNSHDKLGSETDGGKSDIRRQRQTIEASSDSEDSDLDFEEVDLNGTAGRVDSDDDHEASIEDVSVAVASSAVPKRATTAKRKPLSAIEKAFKLQVHKAHLLCLLGHCIYVNSWCNNEAVQQALRPLLSAKIISYLNPKSTESQFVRNRSFMEGLQQAHNIFMSHYEVTASGMTKARWVDENEKSNTEDETSPFDRSDFITAARSMEGSQDVGNQLFCALLRTIGVETRLICSLQPLAFNATAAKSSKPQKAAKRIIFAIASDLDPTASDVSADDVSVVSSASIGRVPNPRRRLGQPTFNTPPVVVSPPKKKRAIHKQSYPIFWVEAFNAAHQKWIPLDPVVTGTFNKASKLEPPSSYQLNQMSYVIAFEDDGIAKDITRRYAKAYNAKTRRSRVESTEGGRQWLKKAMRLIRRRGFPLDREQVEDAELVRREAAEGLPGNVQDFKDHPYYALERHLKRHEVLNPKREVGKVNAGTAAKPRMEAVYRRQDILMCRSADKWYRLGREVRAGEQPVKHVPSRRSRQARSEDEDAESSTGLYAPFQTEQYIPPIVLKGRIPKNAYGNLDIYVPSMVPAGGTHVRHALAQKAARAIGMDYADAVTGFQFKGRHGTAIVQGAVIAIENADAVWAAIEGLEDEAKMEQDMNRSLEALRLWKRFLIGLRIKERIKAYGGDESHEVVMDELDREEQEQHELAEAGGFFPDAGDDIDVLPTAGCFSLTTKGEQDRPRELEKMSSRKARRLVNDDRPNEPDAYVDDEKLERLSTSTLRPQIQVAVGDDQDDSEGVVIAQHETTAGLPDSSHAKGDAGGSISHENAIHDEFGGGFVPEDTAEESLRGHFVPEVDCSQYEAAGHSHEGEDDHNDGLTGGFLHEQAHLAFHMSQDDSSSNNDTETTDCALTSQDTQNRKAAATEKPTGSIIGLGRVSPAHVDTTHQLPTEEKAGMLDDDDEDDRGSLMSHDPEDEDAEPDWLESD